MSRETAYGISIPAEPARVRDARDFADAAAAAFGFDEWSRFQIKLAASEAVTNAIQHGAGSPAERIKFSVIEEQRTLTFHVIDGGRLAPRVEDDDPLREHGRGISFLARFMDEVCIGSDASGTVVTFSKQLRNG